MEHYKYPSIRDFRSVVHNVKSQSEYVGQDENDEAVVDTTLGKPTLTFTGTVKLHGTNASVVYIESTGECYAQSKARVLTLEKDNYNFAANLAYYPSDYMYIFNNIIKAIPTADVMVVYGEWCGGSIQKSVALNKLQQQFIIFDILVDGVWLDITEIDTGTIRKITDFPTFSIDIDFENAAASTNRLIDITNAVEETCPVGLALGVSGTGEGVVWSHNDGKNVHRFKVKGEKHSVSKVKKLAAVDPEKLASITEFTEYAVTENRLEQGIEVLFTAENRDPTLNDIGNFIAWVRADVLREEIDTLKASNLKPKDVTSSINMHTRKWFIRNFVEVGY